MSDCDICTRPSDARLCRACIDKLVAELDQIAWLVDQVEITLTRQGRTGDRNGGRSAERPLPFHHGASVDLESMHGGLAFWTLTVAEQRNLTPPEDRTAPALADWLIRWIGDAAQVNDAAELHGDILALTTAARRTIDRHADLRFVGPCDGHQALTKPADQPCCGKDLYVTLHAREAVCRTDGCGAVYPIEDRRVWLLEQAVDQLRTARQLAYELPWIAGVHVTAKTIGMWSARDKITRYLPDPRDPSGGARFRVGEVIEHARRMAAEQAHRNANGAA